MSKALQAITAALLLWLGLGAPAAAQNHHWLRAETPNFIIYCDRGEQVLREAAQDLEDYDTALRVITNTNAQPSGSKLEIYLMREAQMQVIAPGAPREMRGFYSAVPDISAAFAIFNDAGDLGRMQILFHEYAHYFMLHYYPDAYPPWYIEGFAEYVSTIQIGANRRITVGQPSTARGTSVVTLGLLPAQQLLQSSEGAHDSLWMERFYSTSWLAATWVLSAPAHQNALHAYVEALGRGEPEMQAFEPAFGMSPDAFGHELSAFSHARARLLSFQLTAPPPQVTITAMPDSADDLLLRVARAKLRGPSADDASASADDIDGYAAGFRGDAYAQRASAWAAFLRQDTQALRAAVEPLLAADPEDSEGRYLMGVSYVRDAENGEGQAQDDALHEARRQLARGLRAHPDSSASLYLYVRTSQSTTAQLTDNQMNALQRAFELAPQVANIRLMLVRELMMAQRFDEAALLLRPVLYAPHEPQLATYARRLAEAARNHQPPPNWEDPSEEKEETPPDPGADPGGGAPQN